MAEVKMPEDINISDYPSNSNKSKTEKKDQPHEKKIQKVVSNGVTINKKRFFNKFKNSMVSEDVGTVGEYVVKDIILPTIKDLIFNAARGALEMILYGNASGRNGRGKNVPYNSISTNSGVYRYDVSRNNQNNKNNRQPPIDYFDVNNVGFKTRADAEMVLDSLRTVLEEYPTVSITDFYDAFDTSAPYTANNYGWSNLSGDIKIKPYRGEWYIDFPPYKNIKNIQ